MGRGCFPKRQWHPRGSQHCWALIYTHTSTSQVPAPLVLSHVVAASPCCQQHCPLLLGAGEAGEALGGCYVLLPWPPPLPCVHQCPSAQTTRPQRSGLTHKASPAHVCSSKSLPLHPPPPSHPLSQVPTPSPGGERTTVLLASPSSSSSTKAAQICCKIQPARDPSLPPTHLMSNRSSKAMKMPAGRRGQ